MFHEIRDSFVHFVTEEYSGAARTNFFMRNFKIRKVDDVSKTTETCGFIERCGDVRKNYAARGLTKAM